MSANRLFRFVSQYAWLLALSALLLCAPGIELQAQSSCRPYEYDGANIQYVRFQGNFARGNVNWYPDSSCDSSGGSIRLPGSGVVYATSESSALAICDDNLSGRNTVSADTDALTSNFWVCTNHSRRRSGSSGGKSDAEKNSARPYIPTGITLNQSDLRLSAQDGFHSGIQFQRVGQDGVGIPAVIALGLLDAVDVWGKVGGGYEVCFPQAGRIIFLDAATSPRTVSQIAHYSVDGFTCASGDRAGTLVLVRGEPPPEPAATAPAADATALIAPILSADDSAEVSLANCQIIARVNMHHRASPAGSSKGLVPADALLDATARTAEWFLGVYQGRDGWLNAGFVDLVGDCAYPGAEAAETSEA